MLELTRRSQPAPEKVSSIRASNERLFNVLQATGSERQAVQAYVEHVKQVAKLSCKHRWVTMGKPISAPLGESGGLATADASGQPHAQSSISAPRSSQSPAVKISTLPIRPPAHGTGQRSGTMTSPKLCNLHYALATLPSWHKFHKSTKPPLPPKILQTRVERLHLELHLSNMTAWISRCHLRRKEPVPRNRRRLSASPSVGKSRLSQLR